MGKNKNLYLIGLMGAGKTTVGRLLAKHYGCDFHDSDHEIEARTGVKIPVIFEIEGETGFRKREEAAISDLTAREGIVLATGGGAILSPLNREALRANGLVIYLRGTPEHLYERTRHDRNRPLLQTANPLEKLRELYRQRDPLYREIADIVADTGRQGVPAMTRALFGKIDLLRSCAGAQDGGRAGGQSGPGPVTPE
ncbi:MAG: shikimate kinase [Thiobacillus sp.]